MFRRQPADAPTAASLGACGYPQSFIDALVACDAHARSSGVAGALVLLSIDNMPMIMSGYSMAVAEAVMGELEQLIRERAVQASVARVPARPVWHLAVQCF